MDVPPDRVPPQLRRAAALVGGQALALVLLGAGYAVSGLLGAPQDRLGTVLGGGLALAVGAALLPVARGLSRGRGWAVSPTVVVQLLVLVVAVGLFQGGVVRVGLPLLLVAGAVLFLLATPQSRAAVSRRDEPPDRPR